MGKKQANEETIKVIYDLAAHPERVSATERAEWEMFSLGFTRFDICDAIQKWIEDKRDVEEDVTRNIRKHKGLPFYIMKPHIKGVKRYIKVGIRKNIKTGEYLLIISSHECN